MPLRLVLAGVCGIFGGETLCLLGPIRYERIVHIGCHIVLYAGIALVVLGAIVHWVGVPRKRE
jgi:hypothetical protein